MNITNSKLYSFYLAVVSFVSIIAIAITLWIVITSLWKYLLISDDEYIENRQSWKIEQCSEKNRIETMETKDIMVVEWESRIMAVPSNEDNKETVEECEQKARISAIKARSYDLKDMFIWSFSWLIVFMLLFWFHYPKFIKLK